MVVEALIETNEDFYAARDQLLEYVTTPSLQTPENTERMEQLSALVDVYVRDRYQETVH